MSPRKRPAHPRPRGRPRSQDPAEAVRCSATALAVFREHAARRSAELSRSVSLREAIDDGARALLAVEMRRRLEGRGDA